MIVTNIRIEPKSGSPSLAQAAMDAYATGLNAASLAMGMMAPYRMMLVMYGINRSLTRTLMRR